MQEINRLKDFEMEYYIEASEKKVKIDDLKKYGISEKTLAGEIYLINHFGNEIVEYTISDEVDENSTAQVTSLDDYDIETSMIYADYNKKIDENKFDENIDTAIGGLEI